MGRWEHVGSAASCLWWAVLGPLATHHHLAGGLDFLWNASTQVLKSTGNPFLVRPC